MLCIYHHLMMTLWDHTQAATCAYSGIATPPLGVGGGGVGRGEVNVFHGGFAMQCMWGSCEEGWFGSEGGPPMMTS